MEKSDRILILDFGSQYTQVIARRIRELNVFSEIHPHSITVKEILALNPRGIILSGGPASVYAPKAPQVDPKIFTLGIPLLGICYGMQLIGKHLGGKVQKSERREYGRGELTVITDCALFKKMPKKLEIWNSHGDKLIALPKGFKTVATTENSPYAVIEKGNIYGMQFHPEVAHTPRGKDMLTNFVSKICGCKASWTTESFIDRTVEQIRREVGQDRVILGLSGGVDSSVAAALIHRAIGKQLVCILVDNGLMRSNEVDSVKAIFGRGLGLQLKVVDASSRFLKKLHKVTDPEKKTENHRN